MKNILIRLFCTNVKKTTFQPIDGYIITGKLSDHYSMYIKLIEVNVFGIFWSIVTRYSINVPD